MHAVNTINGRITSALSDDGRVAILSTPSTRLYGEFVLRDASNGLGMWRGEYLGADGKVSGSRVPADVWATAVALMDEISEINGRAEDAAKQASDQRQDARAASLGEKIAQDMDRPSSDL